MKINKFSIMALSAIALGMTACSSDEPEIKAPAKENVDGKFYATVQLSLPGSRSYTEEEFPDNGKFSNSNNGYEVGKTYENNVNNVTIVLATRDASTGLYSPVAKSISSAIPAVGNSDETRPVFNIVFKQEDIENIASQEVYLFAYCNASFDLEKDFNSSLFTDMVGSISSPDINQGIWESGNFLMANAANVNIEMLKRVIPSKSDLETKYDSPEKALNLGTVDVSRVASRFDFKSVNNNIYPIYETIVKEDGSSVQNRIANVEVLEMAPVNIAKEFYYLPRVSVDGTDVNSELLGYEMYDNWVVSPNSADKNKDLAGSALLNKYFYQSPVHAYTDTNYYNYTKLSDLNEEDNDQQWNDSNLEPKEKEGYHIWRYVTENTLSNESSQKKAISTGVVFKAQITDAAEGSLLASAIEGKRPIYAFNGTLYGDIAALRHMVSTLDSANPLAKAFNKVFNTSDALVNPMLDKHEITNEDGTKSMVFNISDENLNDCTAEQNNGTFKIYRPDEVDGNYYIYYLYRNRHNDNHNNNNMGAMEFATVRNNIYKLSITNITEFGHTGDPNDDPDPEDPDDPDEEPKTYIKVACRVVPWMVRVNNIEF